MYQDKIGEYTPLTIDNIILNITTVFPINMNYQCITTSV